MLKLGKFLAEAGVASRRRCKEIISSGRVLVNGQIAESPGIYIDPTNDIIQVDGERILHKNNNKIYILLNKPPGYLSTTMDAHGGRTVMDLIPDTETRLYPVGRLDKDTEGLLLITNDGELTYKLTHPKHSVDKVYLAWVDKEPSEESLDKLRRGIMLEDGITAPAIVQPEQMECNCIRITIHEGRKRQIKRMFKAIGYKVLRLRRIQLGPICLGDLPQGSYRYLSQEEVSALKKDS